MDREYVRKENEAHDSLVKKGYECWGKTSDFSKVYITKGHSPTKYTSEYETYYFDNWQEADKALQ